MSRVRALVPVLVAALGACASACPPRDGPAGAAAWGSAAWYAVIESSVQGLVDARDEPADTYVWTETFDGAPDDPALFQGRRPGYKMTISGTQARIQIGVAPEDTGDLVISMACELQRRVAAMPHGAEFSAIMDAALASGELRVTATGSAAPPISFDALHTLVAARTIPPRDNPCPTS